MTLNQHEEGAITVAEDWLSQTLFSLTGTSDLRLAAERLAEQALGPSERCLSVIEIAAQHNVLPLIREVSRGPSGFVSTRDGTFLISLNSNDNEARRRFTLAHEIGHVMIAQASGKKLHETEGVRTERLLDEFASRIVCPNRVLEKWFEEEKSDISIKTLESAAKNLAVSMMVLVKRLGQVQLLDKAEKGAIIGAYGRSWKSKDKLALRVHQVATPTWGFIPRNRRFSSIGLAGIAGLFEEARAARSASGIKIGRAKILVKKIPSYRWSTLDTNLEQKTYRVRTTGEYYAVVVFEWPRQERGDDSSSP